jgi:hypothetical protein
MAVDGSGAGDDGVGGLRTGGASKFFETEGGTPDGGEVVDRVLSALIYALRAKCIHD